MSSKSIGEWVRSRSVEYCRSSRKMKGAILDEFVRATGVARKTAIGLLRNPPPIKARPRGMPKKRYGCDVQAALELIWAISGHVCSKRLVPALPDLITSLESYKETFWNLETKAKLLKLSPATCDWSAPIF